MGNASKTPVLIALGSNLGDKRRNLDLACERVAALDGVSEFQKSDWLSTQPVGGPASQEIFLNGAATFTTSRPSVELFHALKNIERQLGRENTLRWGPRLIDVDLLLYGEEMFHDPASDLHVPHPRMAFRHFVLAPAAEVAPDMRHPVIGWTISQLLEHLQTSPPVVVFGLKNQGQANRLAAEVSTESGASILSREQWRDASWDDSLISCVLYDGDSPPRESWQRPRLLIVEEYLPEMPRCPFIEVGEMSNEQAVTEIVAAIEAMRQ